MLIIETGILWRRVAKRFEERVNKALGNGYRLGALNGVPSLVVEHRWLGVRIVLVAQLVPE